MTHWALADLPQGWFNHGERALALLERWRPLCCVEVGTWRGASAIAVARVIRHWGGRLTCVDTFAAGPEGEPSMRAECFENFQRAGVSESIELIVGRSVDVAREWAGGPIDYCYIDGDHTYESVSADLEAWWPHVRLGGIVAGDDYDNPPYDGLTKAWDAFDCRMGGLHREGLVWCVKTDEKPYVPEEEPIMDTTVCASCHRAVLKVHVDDEGRCCFCASPPVQRSDPARPEPEPQGAPRLSEKSKREKA